MDAVCSLATARPTETPPSEKVRSIKTPRATSTLPAETLRSFSTPQAVPTSLMGGSALQNNTTGSGNTAIGVTAFSNNTTGDSNTAIGVSADVSTGDLTNATAIGANAFVNASNKVRLGNIFVTVIEGQVPFTAVSDKTQKENFQPVDGEEVLGKIRGFELTSWNFIGHDPKRVSSLWSDGAGLLCRLWSRRRRTNRHGDNNQLRRHSGDSHDRRSGAGEAHGGAKTERGAACGAGIKGRRARSEARLL